MQWVRRALAVLKLPSSSGGEQKETELERRMAAVLRRIRLAELQIQEATTLEELDLGRAAMLSAHAEIQQLIRAAKRDRGIALRPIAETEELHRNLREFLSRRSGSNSRLRVSPHR